MRLEEIDRNFHLENVVKEEDVEWISARDERFSLHGVYFSEADDRYLRMPLEVAKTVSEGVYSLAWKCAGGRLRFVTDSPYIALRSVVVSTGMSAHMTGATRYGFSLCDTESFHGIYAPEISAVVHEGEAAFEGIRRFSDVKKRHMTLYFPLYGGVRTLYIGIKKGSYLKRERPYKNDGTPVVFYGSSITMGGCACRPGTDYVSMIGRDLNIDFINLGFSGQARAEMEMADYIASLPMSVFVYDYDHNAPNVEYLKDTHEAFCRRVREQRPELPIIMVSRPDHTPCIQDRLSVIRKSYDNAIAGGDKNVYLVDGSKFFSPAVLPYATVDTTHPNDLGFYLMAKTLRPLIKKLLSGRK